MEAIWKEPKYKENYERTFSVNVGHYLTKSGIEVDTTDYDVCYDAHSYSIDASGTALTDAYLNSHYTPVELLKELKSYIEKELSVIDVTACFSRYRDLKRMLKDCQGWVDNETEVEQE